MAIFLHMFCFYKKNVSVDIGKKIPIRSFTVNSISVYIKCVYHNLMRLPVLTLFKRLRVAAKEWLYATIASRYHGASEIGEKR